jgi:hypothetical protein
MSRRRGLWSLDHETFAENWATILTFGQLAERDSSVIHRPAQRNAAASLATYSDSQVKMEKSDLWRKDFMYREVAQWRYIRRTRVRKIARQFPLFALFARLFFLRHCATSRATYVA